jgi:hypothetical protein
MNDVTFCNALGHISINMHNAIQGNEYKMIGDLAVTKEAALIHLHKYLREWQVPGAAAANQVSLPIVALEKIKAMCYWYLSQRHIGMEADVDDFDNDVAVAMLELMQNAKDLKEAMEVVMIDKPMALTEISKWTKILAQVFNLSWLDSCYSSYSSHLLDS